MLTLMLMLTMMLMPIAYIVDAAQEPSSPSAVAPSALLVAAVNAASKSFAPFSSSDCFANPANRSHLYFSFKPDALNLIKSNPASLCRSHLQSLNS